MTASAALSRIGVLNDILILSFQLPASSFQLPASSFQLPASRFQLPASRFPLHSARLGPHPQALSLGGFAPRSGRRRSPRFPLPATSLSYYFPSSPARQFPSYDFFMFSLEGKTALV